MPNILFMIGNGFDLNLGLKTRFSDVKNEYLSRDSKETAIDDFKSVLTQDQENWSDFEKAMGLYTEKFDQSNKNIYISHINSFKDVLIEKFEKEQSRIDYLNNREQIISVFTESLANFSKFFNEKSKEKIKTLIEASFQNRDFIYNFITFNYTNILEKCLDIVQSKINDYYLRTFSYQGKEYSANDKIGNILHIHGTLQENLILGVDNIEQIKSEELKQDNEFHWEIVKPKINEDLEENYDLEAMKLINSSAIICIFGISIGETDKTWWEKIFEWLNSNEARHLFIFYYNKEDVNPKNPSTKIKHVQTVKDLFFNIAGNDNEQEIEKCYNRVHIAKRNEDMFKLDILAKS